MFRRSLIRVCFAALLVVGTLAIRWPVLDRKIWNLDEGSTITMAQQVLNGQVLFRDAADNRTPLVPYVKALVLAVAGDWNTWAIHFALAMMIGATAVLLWQTCRRLGREDVGVFAALAFVGLGTGLIPPLDAMAAHTGWFLIFFSSLGFWFFSDAISRQARVPALVSGACFGLAMLAKQPGLLDFGVTVVIVLLLALGRDRRGAWQLLPAMVGGFVLPLLATLVYFAVHGALADLQFYAWTYNTKYYVPEVPLPQRLAAVQVPLHLLAERVPAALALGLGAAVGLLWLVLYRERREPARAILAWLTLGWSATGLLSTMLSGRDFAHYSIQVLPGVGLACGWGLAWIWHLARATAPSTRRIALHALPVIALTSLIVPGIRQVLTADRKDDFGVGIGEAIQRHSRPEERMFIWGYMPELHVFARRLPSTRFFYTNWVTGLIPWTNADWLKDTTYAVIPGTPEQMQRDFERHPPAIIVETGSLRGYLKYPLSGQPWLWRKVRYEFAEVEPALTKDWGFRIYRRISDATYGAPFPASLAVSPDVRLDLPTETAAEDVRVAVHYPRGTRAIELYKDGELYRRMELLAHEAGTVVFTAVKEDLPAGNRRFQAIARGGADAASNAATLRVTAPRPTPPAGPLLEFEGLSLLPLAATNLYGVMQHAPADGWWDVHAPARMVYDRPPGLLGLEIDYKMHDAFTDNPTRWTTDGIDVVVRFQDRNGVASELYRRHLNPTRHGADRGPQRARVMLPADEPGQVTLHFSPGAKSDSSSDWVFLKSVRGIGVPAKLSFRGQLQPATRITTPLGMALMEVSGLEAIMVHAPSEIEFDLRPGMHRLKGRLGLLPSAWNGPKGSAGATFEIWHLPPQGESRRLFQIRLNPVHIEADREPRAFEIELPKPAEGRIRLLTLPTHPQDNSFNHTYWAALTAEEFQATISTPGLPVSHEKITAPNGFNELAQDGQLVTYVHAPSELVFPRPAALRRLRGSCGLLSSAYSDQEATEGARFIIEGEYADGRRVELWRRELDPQSEPADRGFIPFKVTLPDGPVRLVFRTAARPGHGVNRAWTFWHDLRLEP